MTVQSRAFSLDRLIIHEVPAHNVTGPTIAAPYFSEVESTLGAEVKNFFEERIRTAIAEAAQPARFKLPPGTVPQLVVQLLDPGTRPDLVELSKKIAQRLFDVQTGIHSGGLLSVGLGTLSGKPATVIVKLEKEQGVNLERKSGKGGLKTFDLKHLKTLMLTGKTRVFKLAVFATSADPAAPAAQVIDYQKQQYDAVATFFLENFLECELIDEPAEVTRRFVDAFDSWINTSIDSIEKKSKYLVDLIAELQSNDTTLSPKKFASKHVAEEDLDSFEKTLRAHRLTLSRFRKAPEVVAAKVKLIKYTFDNKVVVLTPPGQLGESVNIEPIDDSRVRMRIDGTITDIHGRAR